MELGNQLSDTLEMVHCFTCPKCGHKQPESEECLECGLIFRKYVKLTPADDPNTGSSVSRKTVWDGKKKRLIFLALLLALVLHLEVLSGRQITYPPGILISSEPHIAPIKNPVPWKAGNKEIYPLAGFWLKGRVLCSERYSHDFLSDVSPIDIGLGWGPMSDQSVIDKLEFGQSNRILVFEPADQKELPHGYGTLWRYFKNVHTLPAGEDIRKKVCSVRIGDLIELSGFLVGIKENGRWMAISSMRKEWGLDHTTCLIFWVTHFKRL